MFNLLVSGWEIASTRGSLTMPLGRVFQFTDANIDAQYAPGGVLDEAALMKLPLVVTNESSSDPASPVMARIGKITKIRRGGRDYTIEYAIDTEIPPIPNSVLESLAGQLNFDINGRSFGEFQTNHWAVKDVDLFQVLFTEGIGRTEPRIFKLPIGPIDANLVTVMMPFDPGFNGVFTTLQGAVSAANMRCLRADNIWDHDVIIQDVVMLIGSARVVICDLTNKNPNVFYEAGIAHTIGKDVILIAQHDSDIPFDLRHIRYIKYFSNEQGLRELTEKVSMRLKALTSR